MLCNFWNGYGKAGTYMCVFLFEFLFYDFKVSFALILCLHFLHLQLFTFTFTQTLIWRHAPHTQPLICSDIYVLSAFCFLVNFTFLITNLSLTKPTIHQPLCCLYLCMRVISNPFSTKPLTEQCQLSIFIFFFLIIQHCSVLKHVHFLWESPFK